MHIVIDLSEYHLEWIRNKYGIPSEIETIVAESIVNGTILPEGHGRLVDVNDCKMVCDKYYKDYAYILHLDDTDKVPTIVEAEGE